MIIVNQSGNYEIKAAAITHFSLSNDHIIHAHCAATGETLLLGKYTTSSRALDALVAVVGALEAGTDFTMPADA